MHRDAVQHDTPTAFREALPESPRKHERSPSDKTLRREDRCSAPRARLLTKQPLTLPPLGPVTPSLAAQRQSFGYLTYILPAEDLKNPHAIRQAVAERTNMQDGVMDRQLARWAIIIQPTES